ncbi:hypothetical protein CHS0354_029502, partial [Potamilus streckersoni]
IPSPKPVHISLANDGGKSPSCIDANLPESTGCASDFTANVTGNVPSIGQVTCTRSTAEKSNITPLPYLLTTMLTPLQSLPPKQNKHEGKYYQTSSLLHKTESKFRLQTANKIPNSGIHCSSKSLKCGNRTETLQALPTVGGGSHSDKSAYRIGKEKAQKWSGGL